jgi:membrane-bound serine protease (ClpP class)
LATGYRFASDAPGPRPGAAPVVYEVAITGPIDATVARLVDRAISAAQDASAAAVLVRIDTPGGLVSPMRRIVSSIQAAKVAVICWTGPAGARAASAGFVVMISCPEAAMAPGTETGAAHPVGVSDATELQKVTNDMVAYVRALAEARGRNADWAEAAVRDSVSVPASEALRLHVIDAMAPDVPGLFDAVEGRQVSTAAGGLVLHVTGATIHVIQPTSGERFLHWLSKADLAFLLFVFGIAGIVFEVLHPGLNIPGLAGVVSFILALVLFDSLPVDLAGVLLLVLAFLLFLVDLKFAVHGLPTVAGLTCFVLGGLFLYEPAQPTVEVSRPLLVGIAVALAAFFAVVVRAAVQARHAPLASGVGRLLGVPGVVVVELAPTGQVRVRGEVWAARLAEPSHEAVPARSTVRVLAIDGLTLVVEPAGDTNFESSDDSTNSEVKG